MTEGEDESDIVYGIEEELGIRRNEAEREANAARQAQGTKIERYGDRLDYLHQKLNRISENIDSNPGKINVRTDLVPLVLRIIARKSAGVSENFDNYLEEFLQQLNQAALVLLDVPSENLDDTKDADDEDYKNDDDDEEYEFDKGFVVPDDAPLTWDDDKSSKKSDDDDDDDSEDFEGPATKYRKTYGGFCIPTWI